MRTPKFLSVFAISLFCFFSQPVEGQVAITWYDDHGLKVSNPQTAATRVETEKRNNQYYRTSFDVASGKLIAKGMFVYTTAEKQIGVHTTYHTNGLIADSAYYDEQSTLIYSWSFYPSGKPFVHVTYDPASKKEDVSAWDEAGNIIPNFIHEKDAAFDGGLEGWKKHLVKHLNPNVPVKKKAKRGRYQVVIRFTIEKDGSLVDMQPETNHGHGMEEEAMRVLKLSPNWIPAIQNNKKVRVYRKQPILFVVE